MQIRGLYTLLIEALAYGLRILDSIVMAGLVEELRLFQDRSHIPSR